jgi:5-methylcytosine-specific restriction protein B
MKALLETANLSINDLPRGNELFPIGNKNEAVPDTTHLLELIRSRQGVRPFKTHISRYNLNQDGFIEKRGFRYGFITSGEMRYVLFNQGSIHKLPELEDLANRNGITWTEIPNEQQGNNQGNNNIARTVKRSPNVILYGPPGTGKTYATISVAAELMDDENENTSWDVLVNNATTISDPEDREEKRAAFAEELGNRIHFITFHQSYSYEDFIGGLRPVTPEGNASGLQFEWTPGIFLRACAAAFKLAQKNNDALKKIPPDGKPFKGDVDEFLKFCLTADMKSYEEPEDKAYPPVILVIDEINRANMSRVFGELITLLEEDKRLGGDEQLIVQLPNRPDCKFGVPKNLIIIGTMNTADKSLALLDLALRRRFEFHRLDPKPEPNVTNPTLREFLTELNTAIAKERKSLDYGIGHAYFMRGDITAGMTAEQIKSVLTDILRRKIVPLLQEYFGGDDRKVIQLLEKASVILTEAPENETDDKKRWINIPVEFKWAPVIQAALPNARA